MKLLSLLLLSALPLHARAEIPAPPAAEAPAPAGAEEDEELPPHGGWRHPPRVSLAIGPAWVHVLRDNYSQAFGANGFNTPSRDRVGFDMLAYINTASRWQVGLGMTSFSLEQISGTSAAEYSNGLFGVYVARNLSHREGCDFTVGTLIGGNRSELTVFSATKNGRLRETSAVVVPSLGMAERLNRYLKLGLRVSYAVPFGESTDVNGQDPGVTRIGVRGLMVAADLILGRY